MRLRTSQRAFVHPAVRLKCGLGCFFNRQKCANLLMNALTVFQLVCRIDNPQNHQKHTLLNHNKVTGSSIAIDTKRSCIASKPLVLKHFFVIRMLDIV